MQGRGRSMGLPTHYFFQHHIDINYFCFSQLWCIQFFSFSKKIRMRTEIDPLNLSCPKLTTCNSFERGLFERLRWQCHQTEPHHRPSLPRGNGQDCDVCRCNLKSTAAVCTEERGHEQVSKESGYPLESFKHWDNQKVTPPFIS